MAVKSSAKGGEGKNKGRGHFRSEMRKVVHLKSMPCELEKGTCCPPALPVASGALLGVPDTLELTPALGNFATAPQCAGCG